MDIFLICFLTGVALSMDAFSVAVCKGLSMKKINYRHGLIIALYFGGFQALMPFLGWLGGTFIREYVEKFDHWIAFVLLAVIGINMIREAFQDDEKKDADNEYRLDHKELLLMAIATSIDALAVGISFAFDDTPIGLACPVIGITTFVISFIGVALGNRIGQKFQKRASVAGGCVLILIGLKILFEHLGFFAA